MELEHIADENIPEEMITEDSEKELTIENSNREVKEDEITTETSKVCYITSLSD